MKIAYLHGLESSIKQDDPKIIFLNKHFDEVYTPQINYRDGGTFNKLLKDIQRMQPDLIVGSSMGGYVSYLIGNKLSIPTLLFNPALIGRSFDPVVDDSGLKGTKHTIFFGKKDKVISGNDVKSYLKDEGVGQFSYNSYNGGHRVPADVFINGIKNKLNIKETYNMKYVKLYEEFLNENLNEAKRGTIHKAAKKGSYPAVVVVVQDGKVIHQEKVVSPEHAPAVFNVMQEKYPKALIHLEDNTGKRLFSESVDEAADFNDPVLIAFRAAKTKREKELAKPKRKPLYGKQRRKAEDNLWQISQDLKDLYAERGQMLIDMEQEAEVEGGPIANKYGDMLNKIEDDIQKLITNRNKLEIRLAESVVNEAWFGPFVFNDKMSDDELKAMYDEAIDGYAYHTKGMQYPKSDYKKAYQAIEKILKKRGINVDESVDEGTAYKNVLDKSGNTFKHGRKYKTDTYGIVTFIRFDKDDKYMHLKSDEMGKIKTSIDNAKGMQLKESVNESKKKLPKFKNIPSWANYVAQQSDGEWTWYEDVPTMIKFKSGGGAWKQDGNQTYTGVKTDGSDWDKIPTYYKVKNGEVTESLNEAKLFKTIEKTGKLKEPDGGRSMNGKYYQLQGDSEWDVIHFSYDAKSKKPFGVAQIAGHHMPSKLLKQLGFRETNSWTAGVEVYIYDGNYNPKFLSESEMAELVTEWGKGFGSYANAFAKFYRDRGRTSGTID